MKNIKHKIIKDRPDMSSKEYLNALQEEWANAWLRTITFPPQYRDYWENVMRGKERKIQDNNTKKISTVLDSALLRSRLLSIILPENEYPTFIYWDEEQRKALQRWDLVNYFALNSSVSVCGHEKPAKIHDFDFHTMKVDVVFEGEAYFKTFDASQVKRTDLWSNG